ncbi:type 1 periplasmic-binding domain-containing protein [Neoroseomonas soli]|uniref:Uncharacterized protein n=1 Tax=Neoroseomonas soli TaxID=1081025 RepID=A0A9X9X1V8_9PROT|nr:hypothetical protein [Neoroseomonas soli]MBR0673387.1 hypothetical protein [Neoroseomonas soli]
MSAASPISPSRAPLAWRLGVTGHRDLAGAQLPALRAAVAEVLAIVRGTLDEVAADDTVAAVHETGAGIARVRLISPLADGADRLVAEEALRQGCELDVVLPFAQDAYEQTFGPGAVNAFRALRQEARAAGGGERVLVLDGAGGSHRRQSYRAVGRFIVRNCDLLIAIWDGEPAAGRGGTGDVVHAAIAAGLPVWCIDPARPETPRLIDSRAEAGMPPQLALARNIRQAICPVETGGTHAHGFLAALARRFDRSFGLTRTPLEDYLGETAPGPPLFRRAYADFMRIVAPPLPEDEPAMPPPQGAVEQWWEAQHQTAATFSKLYGDRYRSSYVLVFILAALALVAAALAFVVPRGMHVAVTVVELAALSAIALLVGANHLYQWHDRWISYRLLAELCRKQRVLAPIGWTLPVRDVARILSAGHGEDAPGHAAPPRDAWVAWYFAALRRGCPMPGGCLAGPALERARRIGRGMFEDQGAYHRQRQHRCEAASRRLAHWGDIFFLLAMLGVVLRIVLELLHAPGSVVTVISVACFASPAASAALLGIRAYAEFELLARQSARMRQVMADALAELDALPLDGPLASNALGGALVSVTAAMLLDIDGWAQLFHVKAVEAG